MSKRIVNIGITNKIANSFNDESVSEINIGDINDIQGSFNSFVKNTAPDKFSDKERIIELLSTGLIGEAIKILLSDQSVKNKIDFYNDIILLSGQYHEVIRECNLNLTPNYDSDIKKAKICRAILELVNSKLI